MATHTKYEPSVLFLRPQRTPYPYRPLDPKKKEIRILQLFLDSDDSPLRCSIHHSSTEDPARNYMYFALSYVWGHPEATEELHVGQNHFHKIPKSLSQALLDIRVFGRAAAVATSTESELDCLYVWADAVCINQSDVEEKVNQIPLMGSIYRDAADVFVYTGPAISTGVEFERFVDKVARFCIPCIEAEEKSGAKSEQSLDAEVVLPPSSDARWDMLKNFILREWQSRAWIRQEVLLSKRDPYLLCGSQLISFSALGLVLYGRDYGYLPALDFESGNKLPGMALALRDLRLDFMEGASASHRLTLANLLYNNTGYRSSDPRDQVYSLMNVASDWSTLGIEIDYTIPPEKLFTRVAARLINSSQSLMILGAVEQTTMDLPSWVPDWSQVSSRTRLTQDLIRKFETKGYNAGGAEKTRIWADEESGTLTLEKAFVFDQLTHVSDVYHSKAHWVEWMQKDKAHSSSSQLAKGTQHVVDTSFLPRADEGNRKAEMSDIEEFRYWFDIWIALDNWQSEPELNDRLWARSATRFWDAGAPHRRLCRTRDGRMGLLPATAEIGDIICVVPGAQTPFIIRRVERGFKLIGECYVHNAEDGKILESELLTFEKITIV